MDIPLQIESNFVVLSKVFEAEAVEVFDADDVRDTWRGDRQSWAARSPRRLVDE